MIKKQYFVLIGIITLLGFLTLGNYQPIFSSVSSATVLSVDKIELRSNVPELGNNPAFLITLVANGGGETLVGEINEETLKQMGIKDVKAGKFKIKVYLEELKYNYPLTQSKYFSGEDVILYQVVGVTTKQDCLASSLPWNRVDKDFSVIYYYYPETSYGVVKTMPGIFPRGIENHIPKVPYKKARQTAVQIGKWGYWMPEGKVKVTYVKDQWGRTRSVEYDFGAGECQLEGVGKGDWFVTNLAGIPYARVYDIGTSANKYYKIRVVLEREDGDTVSTVITPDRKTATLGDIGRVKLVGDLGGERTPEIPAVDYKVIKYLEHVPKTKTKYGAVTEPNTYKFVGRNVINTYTSSLMELADLDNNYYTFEVEEGIKRIRVDPGVGAAFIIGKWNTLNNMLAASIEDSRKPSTCSIAGSMVSCEGKGQVSYPMLQLLVRADWIGMEVLSGIPEILEVNTPAKVYEGDTGILKVKIRNGGEVSDSFDISLSCPSEVSTTNTRLQLSSKEEREATLTYTSTIPGQYNCSVSISSVNSGVSDTEPILITIAQKPLPEEITLLKDIPQKINDLTGSVEQLTKTVSYLMAIIAFLALAFVGMLLLFGNRILKK